jgi:hypothetical protein
MHTLDLNATKQWRKIVLTSRNFAFGVNIGIKYVSSLQLNSFEMDMMIDDVYE